MSRDEGKFGLRRLMDRHPREGLLVEYAEGLVDSTARLNLEVASHVSGCARCRGVVDGMRGCFDVVNVSLKCVFML